MRSSTIGRATAFGLVLASVAGAARADILTFSFTDPLNDQTAQTPYTPPTTPAQFSDATDLVGVNFTFDNTTGDYTLTLQASPANPFYWSGRFDFNFMNPDVGARTIEPYYVMGTLFYSELYSKLPATTELTYSGNSTSLLHWKSGDRVAASSIPFGAADDESRFVIYTGNDGWYGDDFLDANAVATISSVPEPSVLQLLSLGGFFLFLRRSMTSSR